jgi:hypothetical protein
LELLSGWLGFRIDASLGSVEKKQKRCFRERLFICHSDGQRILQIVPLQWHVQNMLITLSICWVPGLATTKRLPIFDFDDRREFFERKKTGTRKSSRKSYQTDGYVSSIHDILPISIISRDLPEDSTSIAEAG